METMKKIKKEVSINAPRENVWEVLTNNNLNKIWYAEFMPGSHTTTDWQLNSKAMFMDATQSGIVGFIQANVYPELLSIEYTGQVINGVEDYDSEIAKQFKGVEETYRLAETNGITTLAMECDMAETHFDHMSAAWDKALLKVKELAENK